MVRSDRAMKSKLQLQPGPILDFGASPMLAMRKLIIPAGHRALGCLVRVRKRSGAGRGRVAGRRRGTCGARMPNGLAGRVSEASAWMAVTEASEGEDNVGYGLGTSLGEDCGPARISDASLTTPV